jgi:hypothetical protein
MIEPSAKEQALKHVDEAIKLAAGDEAMTRSFKAFRDKLASAEAPSAAPSAK